MEMILPDANELRIGLDELSDRMRTRWEHLFERKSQTLRGLMEQFGHLAPTRRLMHAREQSEQIRQELDRAIRYRLEHAQTQLTPQAEQLGQAWDFLLKRKQTQLDALAAQLTHLDPTKRTKEGWAEVLVNGKRISLKQLTKGDRFRLFDGTCSVEADVVRHCREGT